MKKKLWQLAADVFEPTLALVVHEYTRQGKFNDAERIEKNLLNPLQRRIGAPISHHAETQRRVVNG